MYGIKLSALPLDERLLIRRCYKFVRRHPDRYPTRQHWYPPSVARHAVQELLYEWNLEEALPDYLRNT